MKVSHGVWVRLAIRWDHREEWVAVPWFAVITAGDRLPCSRDDLMIGYSLVVRLSDPWAYPLLSSRCGGRNILGCSSWCLANDERLPCSRLLTRKLLSSPRGNGLKLVPNGSMSNCWWCGFGCLWWWTICGTGTNPVKRVDSGFVILAGDWITEECCCTDNTVSATVAAVKTLDGWPKFTLMVTGWSKGWALLDDDGGLKRALTSDSSTLMGT